jgi:hypothetical protein
MGSSPFRPSEDLLAVSAHVWRAEKDAGRDA